MKNGMEPGRMKNGLPRVLAFMALSAIGTLAACSPVKEYRRPEVQLPATYPGPVTEGKEMASIPYRSFFQDPDLCALIDSAVANNNDLLISLKNIEYARQSLDVARYGMLPTLTLDAAANYSNASDNSSAVLNGQKKVTRNYTAELKVSWEADIWAKIRNSKKAALAEYLRSTDATRAVRTRLVSDVAQGYWNLKTLDAQIDITNRNIALADSTLRMMHLQYDAGNVTALAIQQQESQLLSSRLLIPKLEASRSAQQNALSILAGRMPGSPVVRTPGFAHTITSDPLGTGVPLALLHNRPDVRAAEELLMEQHALMGSTKALLYPSISITAQGGLNAIVSSRWFSTPGSIFDLVQASVFQPVFMHGQLKAQYEQSKIRRDQAELTFRQTLLKAVGEVSDALVQVEKTGQQETIAMDRLATLRLAVKNSRLLFQSGMATYFEVIIAESALLQSELDLADIRRSNLSARADLYRSVGGGWQE